MLAHLCHQLIGVAAGMRKKTIVILHILSIVSALVSGIALIVAAGIQSTCGSMCVNAPDSGPLAVSVISVGVCGGVAIILWMIGWIGTLVNLGRAREWTWFVLTLFLGDIMVFIYLLEGPNPIDSISAPYFAPYADCALPE